MFLWFPPSCGFHLFVVSTLCGYSVVCTLLLFASSCGYSWCHFRSLHFRGLHSAVVSTLLWFASLRGSHPPCGYSMVSLPWFALSWYTLSRGFHPPVVCIFAWFPPSLWLLCGVPFVVCTIMLFTLCRGFHPPVVCIFTWFLPSLWLLCGVPFVVCTITWFTLCRGFHPPVVCIFTWFPPSRGYSVVSIRDFGLNWPRNDTFCGSHSWFPPSCGIHPGFWLKLAWK